MWWSDNSWVVLIVTLIILVVYWAVMIRTIVDMVRHNANTVMLVFTCLSLAVIPPLIIHGILWIIAWNYYKSRMGIPRG